ncbi:MAG: alpha/beta fold hydrolase [Micavibrio sp.]|nr:MAG: alpha/beta fold hydrolase [Micavibrio sp.]
MKFLAIVALALALVLLPRPAVAEQVDAAAYQDYVVLLHGITRSSRAMQRMEDYFRQHGYHVINIDYKSREYTIDRLAEHVYEEISDITAEAEHRIHFVGHSMGGLIIRAILNRHRPENLGRVVMLGTPNQGSEVADFLENNILFQNFYGPAGLQLVTDQRRIAHLFGEVDFDLGIIAGTRSIDPLSSLVLPGSDDGKVTVERTKLEGMTDHLVLPTTHTFMMRNAQVLSQTRHFIENGTFAEPPPPRFNIETRFQFNR